MGCVSVDLSTTDADRYSVFCVLYSVCWTRCSLLHTLCILDPSAIAIAIAIIIIITFQDSSPGIVLQRRYRICTAERKRKYRRWVSIHDTRHLIYDRRTLKRRNDLRTPLSTPCRGQDLHLHHLQPIHFRGFLRHEHVKHVSHLTHDSSFLLFLLPSQTHSGNPVSIGELVSTCSNSPLALVWTLPCRTLHYTLSILVTSSLTHLPHTTQTTSQDRSSSPQKEEFVQPARFTPPTNQLPQGLSN